MSSTVSVAGARETCNLCRFKSMQATDLTIIYLYNVFVLGRVVDASVISSVAILYWIFFCICLCFMVLN